jgi:3-deoxy-D-manno-octulosonic-acid transferase
MILDAFIRLRKQFSDLRLIVAPRRIERIAEIRQLVLARSLKPVLKTDFTPGSLPYDVLLLNTIGELEKFYALADITFVGGSLVPIGGHNLLEPAGFGKPVLFGPYTHNFEVMAETLLAAGGGARVHSPDELYEILVKLLADPDRSAEMGTKAQNFVKENSGALTRTIAHMENLLAAGKE